MQNIEIVGYVKKVWDIVADVDSDHVTRTDVETNEVRCPDVSVAKTMIERIKKARKDGDSLGGVVEVVARGVPPGLGEPVFDKLDAQLAGALLSLPACKGFEIGSGFDGTSMTGSEHNDPFYSDSGRIRTRTNHSLSLPEKWSQLHPLLGIQVPCYKLMLAVSHYPIHLDAQPPIQALQHLL